MSKILVIDDEQTLREEIRDVLMFEGYEVIDAENGRVGVQLAQDHLPDLVISDIMMPEMDGYSTLISLRANPVTATIPFIFLSAKTQRSSVREGMENGANDYLTKPFTHAELLGAVKSRLDERANMAEYYEQKLNDLSSAITHTLPHELRTPLVSILGFAELLTWDADQLSSEQVRQMAEAILHGGKRLHRIIENYLTYAQITITAADTRKLKAIRSNQTTNPMTVISTVAETQAKLAERESDLYVRAEDATVWISKDDLEKIVEELVNNAFKFSGEETEVHVTSTSYDGWYHLCVEDSGRGMTRDQIKGISAFMQFDRSIHEQQGAGLGLIITKCLVNMYGGSMMIESNMKQGAKVIVRLPALAEESEQIAPDVKKTYG